MAWASPVSYRRESPQGLVGNWSWHSQWACPRLAFQLGWWDPLSSCYGRSSPPRFPKAQQEPRWPVCCCLRGLSLLRGALPLHLPPWLFAKLYSQLWLHWVILPHLMCGWKQDEKVLKKNEFWNVFHVLLKVWLWGRENWMSSFLAWKGRDM